MARTTRDASVPNSRSGVRKRLSRIHRLAGVSMTDVTRESLAAALDSQRVREVLRLNEHDTTPESLADAILAALPSGAAVQEPPLLGVGLGGRRIEDYEPAVDDFGNQYLSPRAVVQEPS